MKRFTFIFLLIIFSSYSFAQDSLLWKFKSGAAINGSPLVIENSVFFGSSDMNLYSLDKNSGKLNWKFETNGEIRSTPCVFENDIFINSSDGNIYSIDKSTGKLVWKFVTKGERRHDTWDYNLSSPVAHNGIVYAGSGDSTIYAIGAKSGKPIWTFKTNGIVHASPTIRDSVLYIGSFDGFFYALDSRNGNLIWKFNTVGDNSFPKGEVQNAAFLISNTVFFGSRDHNTYALNIKTGNARWNVKEIGSWVIATPFIYKDNLYVGTSDTHRFICMDAKTGRTKWSVPLNMRVYGQATLVNGKIVFGCFNGKLYFVDPETGNIDHVFQSKENKSLYPSIYNNDESFRSDFVLYGKTMPDILESERRILELGSIISRPILDNNTIYYGATNGFLYALRVDNQ